MLRATIIDSPSFFFIFSRSKTTPLDPKSIHARSACPDAGPRSAALLRRYPLIWSLTPYFTINVQHPASGNDVLVEISPVPEADTYAMMLAGLGLVGFAAAHRNSVK